MHDAISVAPMALHTAMSPSPFLATRIDERQSGTVVPAEMTTMPITIFGISRMHPTRVVMSSIV